MQVRQFFLFTILVFFLFPADAAFAQKLTTNDNGEKIVVYPDGSWHYFDEAAEIEGRAGTTVPQVQEADGKKSKKAKKNKRASSKKRNKQGKEKTSGKRSAREEERGRRQAITRADQAAAEEENARIEKEDAVFQRLFLEEELEAAYHNIDRTTEDIAAIEVRLNKAKQVETVALARYENAKDRSKIFEKMIDMPEAKRAKLLARINAKDKAMSKERQAQADIVSGASTPQGNYGSASLQNRPPIRNYDPKTNLLLNPPTIPCQLVFDDVDTFSGKKRKETAKKKFFTHTPERFRAYFKGREYIVCEGALLAVDGMPRSFNVDFTIATEQATREFGVLEKGSQFILRLIDGKRIILINSKTATGIADPVTKTTRYAAQYLVDKGQVKALREAEIDKVRIIWATGYEDYEVYEVDFFKDLFDCLD